MAGGAYPLTTSVEWASTATPGPLFPCYSRASRLSQIAEDDMGFVKIHDAIFSSSIIEEDLIVRWIWICFLAACDRNGNVHGTEPALARKANVTLKDFQKAVAVLTRPDSTSTSPDHGGRRLVKMGGNLWFCVNYLFYRNMKDPVEERESAKLRQRKSRANRKKKKGAVTDPSHTVTKSNDKAEAEAEADKEKTASSSSSRKDDDAFVAKVLAFWAKEDLRPKARGVSSQRRSAILARARQHTEELVMEVLENRANSRFLCFEFNNGVGAPIDWCFGPQNFVKVMDGNYNDSPGKKKKLGPDDAGYYDDDPVWIFETYRREDMTAHGDHPKWNAYLQVAAEYVPRSAPTFDEWLMGEEE